MTSIFSSQNLQTFRRRKYCFLPPGAPAPPSLLPERSLDPDSLRAAAIVVRSLLASTAKILLRRVATGDYTSIAPCERAPTVVRSPGVSPSFERRARRQTST